MPIAAYPNPIVNGCVGVDVELNQDETVQLAIFDADGTLVRTIYAGKLMGESRKTFETNTAGLEPGIYYLKLVGTKRSSTRRLIIKK